MRILSVRTCTFEEIETETDSFRRFGPDSYEIQMGDSWEPLYLEYSDRFKGVEQAYQDYKKGN